MLEGLGLVSSVSKVFYLNVTSNIFGVLELVRKSFTDIVLVTTYVVFVETLILHVESCPKPFSIFTVG